ncbi:hypothetical protein Taro_011566 [Colocasia esculenta]|uniref:Uncharacterized protein n=1 Tax=Colocasia esculenta TaxID=4460 RepID=A0A843UB07_COLES|nr:hypothetical protein [Colocasia esculenta]
MSLVVTPGCFFPTSWRSGMLVCAGGCFRIVFESVGSTGVVFGLTLVVGHGISLFRCFVALCSSFASALLEFLLLWLVRDWLSLLSLVHEAHPPTLFRSVGGGTTFGGPWRGVWEVGSLQWYQSSGVQRDFNELITMAVPKTGTSMLLAHPCIVSIRVRVSAAGECLLLLLGARAASVVAIFARAAVGFILGLRIHVCAEGCFRIVFDSASSAEVMFGPTLVVGRGISLFRCFVALYSSVDVTAPTLGPPAPVGDSAIGTIAHGIEDPKGLTDRSNKICNESK